MADDKKPIESRTAYPENKVDPQGKTRVQVLWFKMSDFLETKKKAMLAVCGYSKRVWKIASPRDFLSILVIQDIIISDGKCEEGERCLDFECPLNRTTWQSFRASQGITAKAAPTKFGEPLDFNKDEKVRKMYAEWVKDHPKGGVLQKCRSGRARESIEERVNP